MRALNHVSSTKRATALISAIIILSVASFTSVMVLRHTIDMNHLNEKRLDSVKAVYVAEGGIEQVKHYFNFPEDYTDDPDLFYYDESTSPATYSNMETALSGGEIVLTCTYPVFYGPDGVELGRVTHLSILPGGQNPVPHFAKIKSVGETRSSAAGKQEKTIIVYFNPGNPYANASAAIISKSATMLNGNIAPYWGEVWAKNPIDLINGVTKQDLSNYLGAFDDWTVARTENYFYSDKTSDYLYLDGRSSIPSVGYGSLTPIDISDTPYYYQPMYNVSFQGKDLGERFYQYQDLEFPEYDYELWKELAQRQASVAENRSYYTTQLVGNQTRVYRADGALVNDMMGEFFGNAPGSAFRIIFIDTLDGNPPNAGKTNLGNLSFSGGTTPHLRGVFYCNANIGITGLGNPPNVTCEKPDGTTELIQKLWVDGLVYSPGTLGVDESSAGNFRIYGSLVIDGNIDSQGNPRIYYNYKLMEGMYFPLGSRLRVRLFEVL